MSSVEVDAKGSSHRRKLADADTVPFDDTLGPAGDEGTGRDTARASDPSRIQSRSRRDFDTDMRIEEKQDKAQEYSNNLLRRCIFNHQPHKYEDLPIQPGITFYNLLAPAPSGSRNSQRRKEGRLRINLPDTIIYSSDGKPRWFYTSQEGYVYRADGATEKYIMNRIGNPREEQQDMLVAVLKKGEPSIPTQTKTDPLSTKQLSTTLATSPPGVYCIQKFVNFKGPKASIIRCEWNVGKSAKGYVISNKGVANDVNESDFKKRYFTYTADPSRTTVFKLAGEALNQVQELTTRLVKYVENNVKPRVHFEQLVADFLRDQDNELWLLQVKHFTLSERTMAHLQGLSGTTAKISGGGEDNKSKDYLLFQTCHCCRTRCNADELIYELSLKMILETVEHLKKRGVTLRWFRVLEGSTIIEDDISKLYAPRKVCKHCYDLYLTEQKLRRMSLKFAHAIGVPFKQASSVNKAYNLKNWSRNAALKETKDMPKDWDYSYMAGGEQKVIDVGDDSYRPPEMKLYRFITFFHELYDTPDLNDLFGHGSYYLEYTIFGYTTRMPLQMVEGSAVVPVHKLRVFHFWADEAGLVEFLEMQQKIDVKLYSTTRKRPLSSTSLYLRQFQSGVISKLDYFQLFSTREMAECGLKATLGFVKLREVDPKEFDMARHLGIFIPSDPSYFSCDPLPEEWMRIIPNKTGFLESLPPATRAPRRQWGSLNRRNPQSLPAIGSADGPVAGGTKRSRGRRGSFFIAESSVNLEKSRRKRFAELSAKVVARDYSTLKDKRAWLVKLMIHDVSNLVGINGEHWKVDYQIFGEELSTDVMAFTGSAKQLVFNTTDDINLHCTYEDLLKWVKRFPSAEFDVVSKERSAGGSVSISLEDLFLNGRIAGSFELQHVVGGVSEETPACLSVSIYIIDPEDDDTTVTPVPQQSMAALPEDTETSSKPERAGSANSRASRGTSASKGATPRSRGKESDRKSTRSTTPRGDVLDRDELDKSR